MLQQSVHAKECSVIALDRFIQATRDSGYKNTGSALAELVDNALQAGATQIDIRILKTTDVRFPIEVSIADNGSGMDPFTLRQALRFGGSTRFNDRRGLGRYGMGLPNSSLSQARRLTVHTWKSAGHVYSSYLDVDEISLGMMTDVPVPTLVDGPVFGGAGSPSGTVVVWTRCDRLDQRRISTLVAKLSAALGRRFRQFIWDGVDIRINQEVVEPFDPLYLEPRSRFTGASPFGKPLVFEIRADAEDGDASGTVTVTFSELPVHEWGRLSNEQKRQMGVANGAGVSVLRAGREVDHGWFFLGDKRRENYDDWWRCEIQFDPILDEAFGITHTKQQIRPKAYLVETLSPEIESAARVLNARARRAHLELKTADHFSAAEEVANAREQLLPPVSAQPSDEDRKFIMELKRQHPILRRGPNPDRQLEYSIVEATQAETQFFTMVHEDGRLVLVLNPAHPFYKKVYRHLLDDEGNGSRTLKTQLELVLLAAARCELALSPEAKRIVDEYRQAWSDTLATFLNG